MTTMTITSEYRQLGCSVCGVIYYFPEKWCKGAEDDQKSWRCPNGHGQQFTESEREKLRRERDRLKQQAAQKDDEIARQKRMREAAERSAAAHKGQVTKLKKRASAGVCPCCSRSFQNLRRHMKSKHPDFAEADNVVPLKTAESEAS